MSHFAIGILVDFLAKVRLLDRDVNSYVAICIMAVFINKSSAISLPFVIVQNIVT